jgi:hypothetical protein
MTDAIDRLGIYVFVGVIALGVGIYVMQYEPRVPKPFTVTNVSLTLAEAHAIKSDRADIPTVDFDAPKPIHVIPVSPREYPVTQAPAPQPELAPVPPSVPARTDVRQTVGVTVSTRHAPRGDVCARHDMVRVEYDRGRRWRCVKVK